jgi:sulfur-carrier protein
MPMAVVSVHGPLRKLAGDQVKHDVAGQNVLAVLRGLESRHPAVAGWILDERGTIRRHINVYVNGERGGESTAVADGDRVEVLPAITGG